MKIKITSAAIIIAINLMASMGYAQNVGIGQNAPASKVDIKGNLTVGSGYSGTAAPSNGAIIQGNVGIGTTSPSELLTIGTSSPVTVDNSGNVKIASLSSGSIVVTGTGGLLQLITAPEVANTYLQWDGSAYTWATAAAALSNLTPGAGLSGSAYNGSTAQTWSISYGSTTGTAVQGNKQITVSAGTGMSGGGTITLGSGGTVTLNNSGILSIGVTSPIASTGGVNPTISLGTVGVANGGTGLTSVGGNGTVLEVVSGAPAWTALTAAAVNGWALTGNGSTTAGTDYVGTSDGNDLVFKTNAAENMRLSNSTGNVVIGSGEGGSAVGNILRAPYNNSGGNKTGADFTIAAGAPTGKGGSGNIIFQELAPNIGSPGNTSDLSIMAEVMRVTNTGALSFGSTGTATGNANNVLISGGNTTNPSWGQLPLNDATNAVTGTLAIGNGGTGQTTANAALNAFLPSQTGKSGDYLTTNGTNSSWAAVQAPITLTTTGTNGAATFSSNTLNIPQYQAAGTYVTSLSVTANQGVSGSFTAGATPALTLSLGALTGATSYNGLVVTANTGVITTGTWNGTAIAAANGGTGQTSYTIGDILYASTTSVLSKLNDVATGDVLISGGVNLAPSWGKVGLTTAVSGILPIANGGTNSSNALSGSSIMVSNGTSIIQGTAGTTTTVLHGNASGAPSYSAIGLTTDVTGTLPVANGGTGQITASAAINALLPSQTGNSGQFLTTNGTSASWASVSGGSGTVTSITAGQGLTGGTITTSGTIALPYTEYDATLTQSGSSAPVATIAYNNTGGTITWARSSTGTYTATISGGPTFVAGSTVAFINNGSPSTALYINSIDITSTTVLTVNSFTYSSFNMNATDGGLTKTSVKIQIF